MDSKTDELFALSRLKENLLNPRSLGLLALACVLAGAAARFAGQASLKAERAIADRRYRAQMSVLKLYDLQIAYRKANGRFAGNIDSLLRSSPRAAELHRELSADVDINTLVVSGDRERFRLEANILDAERTLIKIKGPLDAPRTR